MGEGRALEDPAEASSVKSYTPSQAWKSNMGLIESTPAKQQVQT